MLVSELVNQFKQQSILITGDAYIDCEIYGEVTRLAPEAPIPVVRAHSKRFIPGGAANVAKNIALLGGHAVLYGDFGKTENGLEINEWFRSGVGFKGNSGLPERHRIFASNQQLLQILKKPLVRSFGESLQPLAEFVASSPGPVQALVIYDQGYGLV